MSGPGALRSGANDELTAEADRRELSIFNAPGTIGADDPTQESHRPGRRPDGRHSAPDEQHTHQRSSGAGGASDQEHSR